MSEGKRIGDACQYERSRDAMRYLRFEALLSDWITRLGVACRAEELMRWLGASTVVNSTRTKINERVKMKVYEVQNVTMRLVLLLLLVLRLAAVMNAGSPGLFNVTYNTPSTHLACTSMTPYGTSMIRLNCPDPRSADANRSFWSTRVFVFGPRTQSLCLWSSTIMSSDETPSKSSIYLMCSDVSEA